MIEEKIQSPAKENCKNFDRDFCIFYDAQCFHDEETRCYKLILRTDKELMEWMDPLNCSDCNEPICNDCDYYKDYTAKNQ
jgi:hypothetical protein